MQKLLRKLKNGYCIINQGSNINIEQQNSIIKQFIKEEKYELAKNRLKQLMDLKIKNDNENYNGKYDDLCMIGECYFHMKFIDQAIENYLLAEKEASNLQQKWYSYNILFECYKYKNDLLNAKHYLQKNIELNQQQIQIQMSLNQKYSYQLEISVKQRMLAELEMQLENAEESIKNYFISIQGLIEFKKQYLINDNNTNDELLQYNKEIYHFLFDTLKIYNQIQKDNKQTDNQYVQMLIDFQSITNYESKNFNKEYFLSKQYLVEYYIEKQEYEKSNKIIQETLDQLEHCDKNDKEILDIYIHYKLLQGLQLMNQQKFQQGLNLIDSLINEIEHHKLKSDLLILMLKQSKVNYLQKSGDKINSYQLCLEIYDQISQMLDQSIKKIHLNQRVLYSLMKLSFSLEYYEETIEFCEQFVKNIEKNDKELDEFELDIANAYRFIGICQFKLERYRESVDNFNVALQKYLQINQAEFNEQFIDNLFLDTAMSYQKLNDKENHMRCLAVCLEIRSKHFDQQDQPVQLIQQLINQAN